MYKVKNLTSPNKKNEIQFGEMFEQSMGGAYCCDIFIKISAAEPLLLHGRSTGNALWKGNNQVFFPIWTRNEQGYLMQMIAFFDLKKRKINIFSAEYTFIELKSVKNNQIEAINSPHWQPKKITIDLKAETIAETFSWTKIDTEILAIKQRLQATTGGNWFSIIEGRDQTGGSSFIMTNIENAEDVSNPNRGEDIYITGATNADQDFIAHARQDIPMLIVEIERLRKLLKH